MKRAHFIFFVKDQQASTTFYSRVLGYEPTLNVPGMTEFPLPGGAILGLMPETGIKRLLGDALPDPGAVAGTPRSELYLMVDNPQSYHRRALDSGAIELSPLALRDWGDRVAYSLDLDAHILAFAAEAAGE